MPALAVDVHSRLWYVESDYRSERDPAQREHNSQPHPRSKATAAERHAAEKRKRRSMQRVSLGAYEKGASRAILYTHLLKSLRARRPQYPTCTPLVHRPRRRHSRIKLDLAKRTFIARNILLQ